MEPIKTDIIIGGKKQVIVPVVETLEKYLQEMYEYLGELRKNESDNPVVHVFAEAIRADVTHLNLAVEELKRLRLVLGYYADEKNWILKKWWNMRGNKGTFLAAYAIAELHNED